jgi:branched-chain amino acid transport system substrate-binding protein
VRDFAPYIAKIKASGADTVITGNWGSDLSLLVKAANDAGLTASSTPTTPASPARPRRSARRPDGRVKVVYIGHQNMGGEWPSG